MKRIIFLLLFLPMLSAKSQPGYLVIGNVADSVYGFYFGDTTVEPVFTILGWDTVKWHESHIFMSKYKNRNDAPTNKFLCIGSDGEIKTVVYPIPAGQVSMFAGGSAPTGYLICDGSAVSRTTYADLFAVIGTTYGAGNGTTTFNIPDLRQRFPLGKAASGTGSTLGGTGGIIDPVYSADPPNTTTTPSANINNVTLLALGAASSPSHTHDVNIPAFNVTGANPPFLVLNYIIKY